MNSPANGTLGTLQAVLPTLILVVVIPIILFLVAVLITYLRRERQVKSNPQLRFDKSLLRASFDTAGAVLIVLVLLSFLFQFDNNGIRFAPSLNLLQDLANRNPLYLVGGLAVLVGIVFFSFIGYLIVVVKPQVYRGDYEGALKYVRRWKWLPVLHNLIVNMEGGILIFAGRYVEAEQCFRAVEQHGQKSERTIRGSNLGNLGWSLLRQGRSQEAIEVLQSSIEQYPEGADNFNGLGEAFLWLGNAPDQALKYLERGIENKRYRMNVDRYVWGELLANQAWAFAQLGDCDKAIQTYAQALAETEKSCIPALAGLHFRGAQVLRLCGDNSKVIEELSFAAQLDPHGGYGQMAKSALENWREQPGIAQLAIQADAPSIVRAIQRVTPGNRQVKVLRENQLILATGRQYSYVYLLRAQAEGSIRLQVIVHNTPTVDAAVSNPDLKTGLGGLITAAERDPAGATAAMKHLEAVAQAVQMPTSAPSPVAGVSAMGTPSTAEGIAPVGTTGTPTFDPSPIFARKPLPTVTAKDRSPGSLGPSWYAALAFVMTPLISGIILSTFWRRLGKPSWMWVTMACAILIPVVSIGVALLGASALSAGPGSLMAVTGAVGLSYGFVYGLSSVLEGPYQKWHRGGKEAVIDFPYNWTRAGLIGGAFLVGGLVLGLVVYVTRPGPVTFDHKAITLTYPASWKTNDVSQIDDCKTNSECFVWLYEGQFGYSSVLIGRFKLSSTMSATTVEKNTWNYLKQNAGFELESRDTLRVSGFEAARRYYFTPPAKSTDKDKRYIMQIYFVRGQMAYFITAWNVNKAIFQQNHTNIESILNTLVVKTS